MGCFLISFCLGNTCCHAADESTIFSGFILLRIDKILDDISDQISEKNEYLSEPVQKKSSSTGD